MVPLRKISFSDQKPSTENSDTPPHLLSIIFFYTQEKFSNTDGTPGEFFRHCETKKSTVNSDIALLCIKFFEATNILKHWMVPPQKLSALRYKKFSTEKRDTPLPHISYP